MNKYYPIILLVISFFYACNTSEINKDIVIKISKLEITKYEFEKNKDRAFPGNKLKSNKELSKWKKEYLDRCIIMADAYEKKYDTVKAIQKEIQHVSKLMMVQKYGYLWENTVSPIVDANKKVTESKSEKRKKLFYFDYIFCNDLKDLIRITNSDTILENIEEYTKLKNKCQLNDVLESGYISQQWPFITFWKYKDYLYSLKEGEVSHLLTVDDNYYFLYLDHIENFKITEKDKDDLQKELQIGMEKEIDEKKTNEMIAKGNPFINYENVDSVIQFILKGHDISEFKNNLELIRYNIDNNTKKIDFNTFLEDYSFIPMRKGIKDKETLIWYVNQYFYDDYLNAEAEKLGLYNSDVFLLDQKNFQNNVIHRVYIENEIIKKIEIDSSEILNFYNNNKSNFTQSKTITVNMYVFDKAGDAVRNVYIISDFLKRNQPDKTKDASIIKNLREFTPNFKIDMEANEEFSKEFINEILTMKVSSLSSHPIQFHNKYVLLYKKEEEGQSIKKLKNVYNQIDGKIKHEKIEIKKQEILKELKKKYTIDIDKTGIDS